MIKKVNLKYIVVVTLVSSLPFLGAVNPASAKKVKIKTADGDKIVVKGKDIEVKTEGGTTIQTGGRNHN